MTEKRGNDKASGRSTAARQAAIEATRLLGKWTRIAQGHLSFGIGCSCGMGIVNIQARDFELQILDYLHDKHSRAGAGAVLELLRERAGYRPGVAGSITELLRAIATRAPGPEAEAQLALLRGLERSIDSFDEVHRR